MSGIKEIHRREILKQMGVVGAALGAGPLFGMGRSGNAFVHGKPYNLQPITPL
jgi:hypothetical protein